MKGLAESHLEYHFQFLSLWCKKDVVASEEGKAKAAKIIQGLRELAYMEKILTHRQLVGIRTRAGI